MNCAIVKLQLTFETRAGGQNYNYNYNYNEITIAILKLQITITIVNVSERAGGQIGWLVVDGWEVGW